MTIKNSISVIVPTLNESENIRKLVEEIDFALKKSYEIIFIDDHSTDGTVDEIILLCKKYPIKVELKKGERGKTFSLSQGFKVAKNDYFVMIDADLQYPPSAIPKMLEKLVETDSDIVVAKRKEYKASIQRKLQTKITRSLIDVLWNLNCDTQSGLKIFKSEVLKNINITTKNEWTFDIDFLIKAKKKGYKIENYDIVFSPRVKGESKIGYSLAGSFEIIKEGIRLRLEN